MKPTTKYPQSKIASARIAAGMTQQQLADAIGVRQNQLAAWESGARNPKLNAIMKIAAALNMDWSALV